MDNIVVFNNEKHDRQIFKDKSGIYSITNVINNKKYIGSTFDLSNRYYRHFQDLKNKKHKNILLQNQYNKYGFDAFEYKILTIAKDINKLLELEQKYLNENFKNKDLCLNICKIAGNWSGNKHTDKTKEKISKNNPHKRHVEKYDLNGKYLRTFSCLTEASQICGISIQLIYVSTQKENSLCHGFQWKFKNSNKKISKYIDNNGGKRKIYQWSFEGNLLNSFNSVTEAAKKFDIDPSSISACCKGKLKLVGGYAWSYDDNMPKIIFKNKRQVEKICPKTNVLLQTYASAKKAAKENNVFATNITACCRGKQKSAGGFIWKYCDKSNQ